MQKITLGKNILVVSGDVSGDLHASRLVLSLKEKKPDLFVYSIGGARLKDVSDRFLYDVVSKGSFGFIDSIKGIKLWIKLISLVRKFLDEKKPIFVILVDFFGFNRQVLGMCIHRDIPVYYYIPPQVWASRPKRANTLAKNAKEIFAIFPFEVEIYKKLGGNVSFFGHPLLDLIDLSDSLAKKVERGPDFEYKIGILPGSRKSEIENHIEVFIKVFENIKSVFKNSKGYIFGVREFGDDFYYRFIKTKDIVLVRDEDYAIRKNMDFALTASGTATLENALMNIPMIVGYRTSLLNYEIAKAIIKLPYISLVNILLKKEVVKEFVQYDFKVGKISDYVIDLLKDKEKYNLMIDEFVKLRGMLGEKGVSQKIASKILSDFEIL
jgi:lipid-A-disaccharide synthase